MTPRHARRELVGALASGLLLIFATSHAQEPPADAEAARGNAERLLERAEMRSRLDELDGAEADYLEAIDLITGADGEFAGALIRAYSGLANVLAARGDFPEAITVLEEARHISHRNFGLFNLAQAALLDELSAVYEQAGDTRQAQQQQVEILSVAQRHFGAEDRGVVPYHFKLAGYYELARMHGLARAQYERALEIVRADPDAELEDELEPLIELVRIDARTGETSRARRDLEERLQVATSANDRSRAEGFAVLGDLELASGRVEVASSYYERAHAAFDDPQSADAYFRAPRLIDFVPPPTPVDFGRRRNAAYAWGSITASFGVTAAGKAERIAIVVSDPPGLMDALYTRRLAEAVFRPRILDGQPVATSRLRFSHAFRYFLPEED